jgi:hypothetical protein
MYTDDAPRKFDNYKDLKPVDIDCIDIQTIYSYFFYFIGFRLWCMIFEFVDYGKACQISEYDIHQ